jgi:hypothetical protein
MSAPPLELVEEVEALLGKEYRLRTVSLRREGTPVLQIDLGGASREHPTFSGQLTVIARKYLGKNAKVRLTYRHEDVLR